MIRRRRVHARREVSPEELGKLLDTAKSSTRSIADCRALIATVYLTAFATGFLNRNWPRAFDSGTLFHLADDPPSVSLPGKLAKNKRSLSGSIPSAPAVAVELRSYLGGKPAGEKIWPGKWKDSAAVMLRLDLDAAEVPYAIETPAEENCRFSLAAAQLRFGVVGNRHRHQELTNTRPAFRSAFGRLASTHTREASSW